MPSKKPIAILGMIALGVMVFVSGAQAKTVPLPAPDIFLSATTFLQADTMLVVVKNEVVKPTGNVGVVKMRFIQSENGKDWVALVGMPVNKKPGTYKVMVKVPGKSAFTKNIKVSKRKFPVTTLVITPQLAQQGFTAKKIVKTIEGSENANLNSVLDILTPVSYVNKPFINPLETVTIVGAYGDIRAAKNVKIQHLGVDLKAALNTPVKAVNDGKVVFEQLMPDYGNTLVIDHGLGVYSLYLHLTSFNVPVGNMVKQGDIVALSGVTGYATGPHLHFSIKVRGSSVDPLKFIQASQATVW